MIQTRCLLGLLDGGSKTKRESLEAELKEVEGEYKEGETLRQVQMWPVTGSESWSASLALLIVKLYRRFDCKRKKVAIELKLLDLDFSEGILNPQSSVTFID